MSSGEECPIIQAIKNCHGGGGAFV